MTQKTVMGLIEMKTRNEDGNNAGARNIGRLALALIPWALGLGATGWLGVWIGIHEWKHTLSQKDRAAMYVGAAERPNGKIKIEILNTSCVRVTRVDIDGSTALVYSINECHASVGYSEAHIEFISPDGTILSSEFHNEGNCPIPREHGDKAECRFNYASTDERIAKIRAWATNGQ